MTSRNDKANVLSFLGVLLDRRDWVYLLSLLIPLFVYNLILKVYSIDSVPGLAPNFDLMRSDAFFNLGYALFWIGLFAAVRGGGPLRRVVVLLFHAATMLVVIVSTFAYHYFEETGTTLDYGIIALWLPKFREIMPVLASGATPWGWALLLAALSYAALGPLLVTRVVGRWRGWPERSRVGRPERSSLGALGLLLLAFGLGFLSLLIGARSTDFTSGASVSFVRAPFVNLVLTGAKETIVGENDPYDVGATDPAVEHPASSASLTESSQTEKRNVVLIHLESTRAGSVTPYNEDLNTTPFLNELAKKSLLAERAYTTVPHTSKASVSVNCGIEPHLVQPTTEANPGGIPVPCLAGLLKGQGYHTGFFQSSTKDFEGFEGLVKNFGYEDYYPLESMDAEGFEKTNYFGYEDDIMLEPSKKWLEEQKESGEPFLAQYLTGTGHDDYRCLSTRYGSEDFSEDEELNSYLNCLRLQDIFLENLIEQYKELGLYEDTIFILYGDHGEGFGEHRRFQHDDTMWEEGLKVPLLIHAPGRFEHGERVKGLSNHTDILPTVLEMLGYEVKDGEYPGYSLLHQLPEDRTLMFSCFHDKACMASIQGSEKYIYHYGNQPDEFFDLSEDPLEKVNLAGEKGNEIEKRREALLEWRSSVNATY
jgi:lipoteichoic acid synthase